MTGIHAVARSKDRHRPVPISATSVGVPGDFGLAAGWSIRRSPWKTPCSSWQARCSRRAVSLGRCRVERSCCGRARPLKDTRPQPHMPAAGPGPSRATHGRAAQELRLALIPLRTGTAHTELRVWPWISRPKRRRLELRLQDSCASRRYCGCRTDSAEPRPSGSPRSSRVFGGVRSVQANQAVGRDHEAGVDESACVAACCRQGAGR